MFSIIIPTYNRAKFVETAIKSVLDQSYRDFEILIIDDGSTDETETVINKLQDDRIRYFYQENLGRSSARNKGIEEAKGEWICFLDDDDLLQNNCLENYKSKIEDIDREGVMIIGQCLLQRSGEIVNRASQHPAQYPNLVAYIWDAFVQIQSICFHRSIFMEDRFPIEFSIWEDKHLLSRLVMKYPIVTIPESTAIVIDHPNRSINRVDKENWNIHVDEMANAIKDLVEKHPEILLFRSKGEVKKKISESYISRSLDALNANEKELAVDALKAALSDFVIKLTPTYVNTWLKIAMKSYE